MRVDRKRRQYITSFVRALGIAEHDEEIRRLFDDAEVIVNTLEKDPVADVDEAMLDFYRKQRPGEPTTLDSAKGLISSIFHNSKRYDLTEVGRYKVNQKFENPDGHSSEDGLFTKDDFIDTIRYLIHLKEGREVMTTRLATRWRSGRTTRTISETAGSGRSVNWFRTRSGWV